MVDRIRRSLGLHRNPKYIEEYMKEADIRSSVFLAVIICVIEVWMLIRYVLKYVMTGKCTTAAAFLSGTQGYWILLATSILMILYALAYLNGKLHKLRNFSRLAVFSYLIIGIYFGFYVSLYDLHKGRMVICFLTTFMWLTVICIWRPFISTILTIVIGAGFIYFINHFAIDVDGQPYKMEEGNLINYITYVMSLLILEFCVYFQRFRDASSSYRLKLAAITDELTGIPNMSWFTEESAKVLAERFSPDLKPVFVLFDVVNFRTYNDRFGYTGGNKLLRMMGEIVAKHFSGEPYARLSDDFFVALTCRPDFQRLLDCVREDFHKACESETYLDVKFAIYVAKSKDLAPRHAIDRARYALGHLKNRREQYIVTYDKQMSETYRLRQYVLNNIDMAVAKGYIKVYYQPVMWSADGTLCGFEALARWIDPEMGFLSPGQFIPILEESRQIHKLDRCIYESVCKNMRRCMDEGLPVLPTSLNFSRLDFELMDAVGEIEALVAKYDIPRDYLHVEITESALSKDVKGLQEAMASLHGKGYALWLDDFGSGYSSMNVLKDFRFDLVKIDMEFLKNFSGNEKAHEVIRGVIKLAEKLDMMTLTEGVETQEAVDFLRESGCGRLQGFLFGKPMPYEDILHSLPSRSWC